MRTSSTPNMAIPDDNRFADFCNWANLTGRHQQLVCLWQICREEWVDERSIRVPHFHDSGGNSIPLGEARYLMPAFREPAELSVKDGRAWFEWSTCPRTLVNPAECRWPMNWTGKSQSGDPEELVTPSKLYKGRQPLLARLKSCFDDEGWARFKAVTGNPEAKRPRIQLNVYVLNFAASQRATVLVPGEDPPRLLEPVPINLGAGGSLSHYCDQAGCDGGDEAGHVEPVGNHIDNLIRQRCNGATLVTDGDAIVSVALCPHAGGELSRCCRKVMVIALPDVDSILVQQVKLAAEERRSREKKAGKRPAEFPAGHLEFCGRDSARQAI